MVHVSRPCGPINPLAVLPWLLWFDTRQAEAFRTTFVSWQRPFHPSLYKFSLSSNQNKYFFERKHVSSKLFRARKLADTDTVVTQTTRSDQTTEVLSKDPYVFMVHNLLSPQECQAYINRVKTLDTSETNNQEKETNNNNSNQEEGGRRRLMLSNPPQVSLDTSKLWPLPIFCILAGIPSAMHTLQTAHEAGQTLPWTTVFTSALPAITLALTVCATLAFLLVQTLQNTAAPSFRTSQAVALNQDDDVDFIRPLVDRVCEVTNHPWSCFEAPVVTRYQKDAVFTLHNDASPTKGSEWADLGGQRVVTAIVYLTTCHQGGETRFDRLGLEVKPKQGSAVVFFPADGESLVADDRTRHESMPAVDEKWIVQMFGRVGPRVPPPLGIPDSFGNE